MGVCDVIFCNAPINHQCNLWSVCIWQPPPCWFLAVVERTQSHLGRAGMLVSWRSLLPYLTMSLNLAHSAGNINGGTNKTTYNMLFAVMTTHVLVSKILLLNSIKKWSNRTSVLRTMQSPTPPTHLSSLLLSLANQPRSCFAVLDSIT